MNTKLSSVMVQEQKRYTLQQLGTLCGVSEERIVPVVRKLKEFGVLKTVKAKDEQQNMSELLEADVSVADVEAGDNLYYYVFTFVGVIVVSSFVFKSYPKYIKKKDPVVELKLILKVLDKYNSQNEIVRLFNETNESKSFNLLAILLFFLQDYYENGSYRNSEVIIETNGQGEIRWDKTINETFALISNNRPYYTELQTMKRVDDDSDYFRRLHECVITKASKDLDGAGMLGLFELPEADLSDEELEDFGDKEYILYRISRELNVQFNSWKQLILKALYAYVDNSGHLMDTDCFSIYGTTSFNLVWEHICGAVLNNRLSTPLKNLELPKPLTEKYRKFDGNAKATLLDIIERPLWSFADKTAADTLRPDIISIEKVGGRYMFVILDAKYYTPMLVEGKTPKNQPGIESVTKQYLYQLAYSDFLNVHGFEDDCIRNCFILPTENPEEKEKGDVHMQMFESLVTSPSLKGIQVRYLLSSMVYEYYLDSRQIKVSDLNL